MIMEEPKFWKYLTFNDDGISGIMENAPDEEKKEYKEWLTQEEKNRQLGVRV